MKTTSCYFITPSGSWHFMKEVVCLRLVFLSLLRPKKLCVVGCLSLSLFSFTQSVGVGTSDPHASAALEVSSTTQGMLVPRMTTQQRTTITSPATGLLVFDTNTNSFWFKGATTWTELVDSTNALIYSNGPDVYTGMTGNVGIGTSTPSQKLHVQGNTYVSGNLGIGHNDPHAPFHLANIIANRKIVMWEAVNNDHQFYGLGINGNTQRYQVAGPADSHIFYSGESASTSKELLRIKGDGNVGIGVAAPTATLELARGTGSGGTLAVNGTSYSSHFNYSTTENTFIRGGKNGSFVVINDIAGLGGVAIGTGTPLQKLHVQGSTYISDKLGIGETTPSAALQFGNVFANRRMVLWESGDNDHQFFGLGINSGVLRYQVSSSNDNHVFYSGASSGASNELMRITGGGNVGIGTTPNEKLEVGGDGHAFFGNGGGANRKGLLIDGVETNGSRLEAWDYSTNSGMDLLLNVFGGNVGIAMTDAQNKLDIQTATRSGTHGTGRPLYITGNISDASNGVEIRHTNASQGIGFGFNTIYAAGTNADQNLGLQAKGPAGNLIMITNASERIRITGDGNVGIGTPSPNAPLQFGNTVENRKIVLFDYDNNDHQYYGFGMNGGAMRYQVSSVNDKHSFWAGTSSTTSSELFTIVGNGNIGIGNNAPNAPLQFASNIANRKIVLYESANDDHQYYGFGINGFTLRYQVPSPSAAHVFYAGTGSDSSYELVRIKGNGNMDVAGALEIGYTLVSSDLVDVPGLGTGTATCTCPAGTFVIGGGHQSNGNLTSVRQSYPSNSTTWRVDIYNGDVITYSFRANAICARIIN